MSTASLSLHSKPLSTETWPAFARLVEKHNGIFGGCWCISFHLGPGDGKRTAAEYRAMKEARVRRGQAHAALVFEGSEAVGWCQFGPTAELPNIRSRKAYEAGLVQLPDWRITCFFIDRDQRGKGIAHVALEGALREISRLGGGTVEAYPEDVSGRKVSRSFLCSGTLGMFEKAGFDKTRKIAMHRWVVERRLPALRMAPPTHHDGVSGAERGEHPRGRPRRSAMRKSTTRHRLTKRGRARRSAR